MKKLAASWRRQRGEEGGGDASGCNQAVVADGQRGQVENSCGGEVGASTATVSRQPHGG